MSNKCFFLLQASKLYFTTRGMELFSLQDQRRSKASNSAPLAQATQSLATCRLCTQLRTGINETALKLIFHHTNTPPHLKLNS